MAWYCLARWQIKPVLATKFQATPQAPHTRNIGKQAKYGGKNGIAAKKQQKTFN